MISDYLYILVSLHKLHPFQMTELSIAIVHDITDDMRSVTGMELHNPNHFGNAWAINNAESPIHI